MSIWDSEFWIFVLCQNSTDPGLYLRFSLVLVVSEIMFICRWWGRCGCYSVVFKGQKLLCREQLFSLTRVGGSLNPAASWLFVFPIKVAVARCQTAYERHKEKGSWGRQRYFRGDKDLALLRATAVAHGPRIWVLQALIFLWARASRVKDLLPYFVSKKKNAWY